MDVWLEQLFGKQHPQEKQPDVNRPLRFTGWYTGGIQHDVIDAMKWYYEDGDAFRGVRARATASTSEHARNIINEGFSRDR